MEKHKYFPSKLGKMVKIAVIQLNAGADKKSNIKKAESFCRQALVRQARFVALPEVFNFRGPVKTFKQLAQIAESLPGPSIWPFIELAREYKAYILAGSIYEKIPRQKKVFNTSVLINPQGKMIAVYRKRNLFAASLSGKHIRESRLFLPGKKFAVAQIGPLRAGLSICYDVRFPAVYQYYRKKGCQVFTLPSSFTRVTGEAHWEALLKARAIETGSYIIAPNQTGKDADGKVSFGNSMLVSPWGEILARASLDREEIIYAALLLSEVKKARQRLPMDF